MLLISCEWMKFSMVVYCYYSRIVLVVAGVVLVMVVMVIWLFPFELSHSFPQRPALLDAFQYAFAVAAVAAVAFAHTFVNDVLGICVVMAVMTMMMIVDVHLSALMILLQSMI